MLSQWKDDITGRISPKCHRLLEAVLLLAAMVNGPFGQGPALQISIWIGSIEVYPSANITRVKSPASDGPPAASAALRTRGETTEATPPLDAPAKEFATGLSEAVARMNRRGRKKNSSEDNLPVKQVADKNKSNSPAFEE